MFLFEITTGLLGLNSLYIDPTSATVLATSISGIVISIYLVLWRDEESSTVLQFVKRVGVCGTTLQTSH